MLRITENKGSKFFVNAYYLICVCAGAGITKVKNNNMAVQKAEAPSPEGRSFES